MEPLITRLGSKGERYLVEFYDINCPFCAKAALASWRDLLKSGLYVELVYLPIHYSLWKDAGSLTTAQKSFLANVSAFCVQDPRERVEYMLELFRITDEVRNEPEAIERQLEHAQRKFGDFRRCAKERLGHLAEDPELAYELAHEYALSLGGIVTGVPMAFLIEGGKVKKVADGYVEVEELAKDYVNHTTKV
ncbi:MAG: DsbA family protein [Thermoproteus sp. AZ2]|uniref:DsbA family protein n=1 Tax=Thermoproteus sp. AZ2 TaxID=1609232 RepID=A0ACC6V159_9CREN|nr:MAG: DSBA oxidoreductase [Thermoproteus sp. AZ2]